MLRALALAAGNASAHATESDIAPFNGFDVLNSSISSLAIQRGGPLKDGIPTIDRPNLTSAAQAHLADGDSVLGVALDGITRAYPVHKHNWHEVVNDRLGERTVVITHRPLCGTGMAFEARVGEDTLRVGVSGLRVDFPRLCSRCVVTGSLGEPGRRETVGTARGFRAQEPGF